MNIGDDSDPLFARTWLIWITLWNRIRILDCCTLNFPSPQWSQSQEWLLSHRTLSQSLSGDKWVQFCSFQQLPNDAYSENNSATKDHAKKTLAYNYWHQQKSTKLPPCSIHILKLLRDPETSNLLYSLMCKWHGFYWICNYNCFNMWKATTESQTNYYFEICQMCWERTLIPKECRWMDYIKFCDCSIGALPWLMYAQLLYAAYYGSLQLYIIIFEKQISNCLGLCHIIKSIEYQHNASISDEYFSLKLSNRAVSGKFKLQNST